MKIVFKAQTVEELKEEVNRYLMALAANEAVREGRSTGIDKSLAKARGDVLRRAARDIAEAELLKDAKANYNSPAKPC